jgi:hypothetical protein
MGTSILAKGCGSFFTTLVWYTILLITVSSNKHTRLVCSRWPRLTTSWRAATKSSAAGPVRWAYQPPANSTLLLEQTSHQQPARTSQQCSSLRTNQHQPSATSQPNRLLTLPSQIQNLISYFCTYFSEHKVTAPGASYPKSRALLVQVTSGPILAQ